jgi:Protein of unknown function (DUF3175)
MPAKKSANPKKWSASVTTDSTHPPKDLFNKSAAVIARTLASKKVSPKGPGSGMRMLTFYINRAGHNLSASRKAELQKAKTLLSKHIAAEKEKKRSNSSKHRKAIRAR